MSAVTDCSELSAPAYRGRLATFPSSRRRDGFRERETKEWGKPTVFLLFSPLILSFSFSSPSLFRHPPLSLFAFYFSAALILPSPCICSFLSSLHSFSACFPFSLFTSPSSLFHPLLSKISLCLSVIHFDPLSFPSKHFSNYFSAIFFF